MAYKIAALYKFIPLTNLEGLQERLIEKCQPCRILGTILLAEEGINGTIAGRAPDIDALIEWLSATPQIGPIEAKFSYAAENPFLRLKIRLKQEIVSLGVAGIDPNREVGTYVAPEDWNALISDPEMLVIDTRNHYEVAIGSFEGAQNPQTTSFRELPDYIKQLKENPDKANKKIAMFCTGGIRCEKASALMLAEGFAKVYHLKGGILSYLEAIPQEQSKWHGECFVFDHRVSVTHGLETGHYEMCHACRMPITQADTQSPTYRPGVSCPHCAGSRSAEDLARFEERQKQISLAKARGQTHIGAPVSAQTLKSDQPASARTPVAIDPRMQKAAHYQKSFGQRSLGQKSSKQRHSGGAS